MNKYLEKIKVISEKQSRLVIGLMSGTSLDGVDVVLCSISDTDVIHQHHFITFPYPINLVQRLQELAFQNEIDLKALNILHSELGDYFAECVLKALNEWGRDAEEIDLIGSHGQTVYHAPNAYVSELKQRTATLQIGDADHLAHKTGIITISDFRQKDTAAGNEGAPLAPYLDEFLFRSDHTSRVLLNLGGIANFTYLSASLDKAISTDIGPANTLINQAMQVFYGKSMDNKGELASKGKVHRALLSELMRHPFLHKPIPKTTGPEDFNLKWVQEIIKNLGADDLFSEDIIATLTEFTAESVSIALSDLDADEIIVSGGGIHNAHLMNRLMTLLPNLDFKDIEEFGITADAKEAVLMAYLADDFIVTGNINLGKISIP